MTMIKADLIRALQQQENISLGEAENTINKLLEILKNTLELEEDILISGFGKFLLREKKERPGRNPKTKEDHIIKARKTILFHASKVWKHEFHK